MLPLHLLAPYIKHCWILKTVRDAEARIRTAPTGMMSLLFHRGERLFSVRDKLTHPRAFLSGQEISFANMVLRVLEKTIISTADR